jgi:hypothetical protein
VSVRAAKSIPDFASTQVGGVGCLPAHAVDLLTFDGQNRTGRSSPVKSSPYTSGRSPSIAPSAPAPAPPAPAPPEPIAPGPAPPEPIPPTPEPPELSAPIPVLPPLRGTRPRAPPVPSSCETGVPLAIVARHRRGDSDHPRRRSLVREVGRLTFATESFAGERSPFGGRFRRSSFGGRSDRARCGVSRGSQEKPLGRSHPLSMVRSQGVGWNSTQSGNIPDRSSRSWAQANGTGAESGFGSRFPE